MNIPLVVQKYGGTSVGSLDRIRHVAAHIARTVDARRRVVAVISAMGEQTDELIAMAHALSPRPPRRELDMLMTAGERISMALMSIALNDLGTHAVSLTGSQSGIITDTTHGNARISKILGSRIQTNLDQGSVVIVAGFQGVSQDTKEITTLGRGGSDLSAVALAGHLGAVSCQLYKDVDGVFTADPRFVPHARKLEALSWDAMTEMAWGGASVLHPRGAHLAQKYGIPIEIRSSFHLDRSGTIVKGHESMERFVVNAITHRMNMSLVRGVIEQPDALHALRSWLWEQGETPQIQLQYLEARATAFRWSVPKALSQQVVEQLKAKTSIRGEIETQDCSLITLVGGGFWQSPELMPSLNQVVPEVLLLDIKNNAVTLGVADGDLERCVTALHDRFLPAT